MSIQISVLDWINSRKEVKNILNIHLPASPLMDDKIFLRLLFL